MEASCKFSSVVLVDDHAAIREGLTVLLERRGFRIAASAENAEEAKLALEREVPDVLVVDLCMPDVDGGTLIREIRGANPQLKVVVFTGSDDPATVTDALACGAHGFAAKADGVDELATALRAVQRGERYLHPRFDELATLGSGTEAAFTPREHQILRLLGSGLTGSEIAARLVLSPQTVKTHIRNAMGRVHARTRAHAVVIAMTTEP